MTKKKLTLKRHDDDARQADCRFELPKVEIKNASYYPTNIFKNGKNIFKKKLTLARNHDKHTSRVFGVCVADIKFINYVRLDVPSPRYVLESVVEVTLILEKM